MQQPPLPPDIKPIQQEATIPAKTVMTYMLLLSAGFLLPRFYYTVFQFLDWRILQNSLVELIFTLNSLMLLSLPAILIWRLPSSNVKTMALIFSGLSVLEHLYSQVSSYFYSHDFTFFQF